MSLHAYLCRKLKLICVVTLLLTAAVLNLVHYGYQEVLDAIDNLPDNQGYDDLLVLTTSQANQIEKDIEAAEKLSGETSPRVKRLYGAKQVGLQQDKQAVEEYPDWQKNHPGQHVRDIGLEDVLQYERLGDHLLQKGSRLLYRVSHLSLPTIFCLKRVKCVGTRAKISQHTHHTHTHRHTHQPM